MVSFLMKEDETMLLDMIKKTESDGLEVPAFLQLICVINSHGAFSTTWRLLKTVTSLFCNSKAGTCDNINVM